MNTRNKKYRFLDIISEFTILSNSILFFFSFLPVPGSQIVGMTRN